MSHLDKVFLVVFARYRRKSGGGQLESAWRRACNSVVGYFIFPVAMFTLALMTVMYRITAAGNHLEHRTWGRVVAATTVLVIALLLNRRFKRYLKAPPVFSRRGIPCRRNAHLWISRHFDRGIISHLVDWFSITPIWFEFSNGLLTNTCEGRGR